MFDGDLYLPTNVVVMVSMPPRDQRSSVGEATGLSQAEWLTQPERKQLPTSPVLGKAGAQAALGTETSKIKVYDL